MRRVAALSGLITVVIAAAGCSPSTSERAGTPSPAESASEAPAADLPSLAIQATISGFTGASAIVATRDEVWALDHAAATVARIDPATNQITAKITLGAGNANGLGLAGGRLWTFEQTAGEVEGIDPGTARIVTTLKIGHDGDWFWVGDDAAWLLTAGTLDKIDGATARVTSHPVVTTCPVAGAATGGGFTWLASANGGLCKVDEKTGAVVARGSAAANGDGIAIIDGAPWLAGADDGLAIINPGTLAVQTHVPPPAAGTFQGSTYTLGTAGGESTIIVGGTSGTSGWVRYTGATIGKVTLGDSPAITLFAGLPASTFAGGVVEAFGSLWVANFGDGSVVRYQLPAP